MSQGNSAARVLAASLIGTTIEFFDFYIYATAAVLVFPKLFFPSSDVNTAILQSLATFALAFFARPVGAALFGHFGDRIGRKATLVAALMTMGPSTVAIGFLPTYESIGILAPILLALFRFGQGLGLGGEWGGAVLLATENAPEGKRAWYGMFPQMGAPIGFLLSSGTFLILSNVLTDQEFFEFGWRIPFIASAVLVFVGLYVRLKIEETPEFLATMKNNQRVQMPIMEVFKAHTRTLIFATLLSITTFALFYLMTVFTLSWGTSVLHYPRSSFLIAQMIAVVFFAIGVPLSARLADRYGCTRVLMGAMLAVITFGLFFAPLFTVANWTMTVVFLALGLLLMGFTYGPLGTALGLLFPTEVRYTGSSLAFTLAGILGASLAPYIATWLATHYGLEFVGYYLALAATLSFLALVAVRHRLK